MFAWLTGNTDFVKKFRGLILSDLDSWEFGHDNRNTDIVENTKARVIINFHSKFNFNFWLNSNAISLNDMEQDQIIKICKQAMRLKALQGLERNSESPLILQLKERLAKVEKKRNKFSFISGEAKI
jgi:hypothetical protein